MAKLFANSGDPDQTPHSAASDLGLHCLPVTLLRVSRLQWVNANYMKMILGYFFLFFHESIHFLRELDKSMDPRIIIKNTPL